MAVALSYATIPGYGAFLAVSVVDYYLYNDYKNQTMPNGAYALGCQKIEDELYIDGWEAGDLEKFLGKKYGGCD